MKDRISVIIPVYNVADYLPECLESVLNQGHRDLEVILINDGSKDESGAICDAYAARDSRIRVIHQKNAGAAAAKNAGLRIATGEYLSFVDSDDYLEPNVYGYMLSVLKTHGADAAQFSFRDVYRTRTEDHLLPGGRQELSSKEYLARFPKDWTCALLWNKLYKRSLYEGVFFEEGHKIDDEYFTYRGFLKPGKVVWDDRIIYNYRKRASSVMSSPESGQQRILDCLDAIAKRREAVRKVHPDMKKLLDETYLDAIWYLSENPGATEKTIRLQRKLLKEYLTTPGNSLPPRYLWGRLWRMYTGNVAKMLEECRKKKTGEDWREFYH